MPGEVPWIVLGLGNPEADYGGTRHNLGADVVRTMAERAGVTLRRSKQRAAVAELRDGDQRLVLARPDGYMNESGGPASLLLRWYGGDVEHLIVVHDDIDLAAGRLQARRGGGTGGHNGLRDIVKAVGSRDFLRLRLGVGRPPGRQDPADYVLAHIPKRLAEEYGVLVERAADAATDLLHLPLERVQAAYNG